MSTMKSPARHHTTRAWVVPKLRGKYFSVFLLLTVFEIEVLNCDYSCTGDATWTAHKLG
jgi:hypothetical protein